MKKQRLPPLKSLQVFEAVARTGSVVRAADTLHVTQGAVSKQLRLLESELGVVLFERRNRGVHLTAAGAQLQQACAQAWQTLEQAVQAVRGTSDAAPLVLSCEPTLAMHWLIPRLAQLQAQHPQIGLHLVAAGGAVDFERDRVDVAVRRSDIALQPQWQVEPLAPEYMGPVARAAVATQWLQPQPPGPSAGQPGHCLHSQSRPQAWSHWLQSRAKPCGAAWPAMWLEHFYLCLQAAHSGLGVAMASVYMADAAVRSGSLVAPLGWVGDGSHYVLIRPHAQGDARIDVLARWLQQAMQETLALHIR